MQGDGERGHPLMLCYTRPLCSCPIERKRFTHLCFVELCINITCVLLYSTILYYAEKESEQRAPGSDGYPLPYPTRKFFKNFRVQGSNYTCCFSLGLYQPLSSWRKGFSKDCKHFHICPFSRFRNIQVKYWYKYRVGTNISVILMDMALVLFVQKVKTEWAGIKYL